MRVDYTATARKQLRRIGPVKARLIAKILQYAADPASLQNNVTALKGSDGFRLRVGNHRVIFEIDGDTMVIVAIGTRSSIYDRP